MALTDCRLDDVALYDESCSFSSSLFWADSSSWMSAFEPVKYVLGGG